MASRFGRVVEQAIHSTNVERIGDARVVILLDDHDSLHHRRFHGIALRLFYHPGDRILIEDSNIRPPEKLCKGQINRFSLQKEKVLVAGWDNPEARTRYDKLDQNHDKVSEAIKSFKARHKTLYTEEEKDSICDVYEILVSFIEKSESSFTSQEAFAHLWEGMISKKELMRFLEGQEGDIEVFKQKKERLISAAEKARDCEKMDFLFDTSYIRQCSLMLTIKDFIDKERVVFVTMGFYHAIWGEKNPLQERHVKMLLDSLEKTQYVILDPSKINHISEKIFMDFLQEDDAKRSNEAKWLNKISRFWVATCFVLRCWLVRCLFILRCWSVQDLPRFLKYCIRSERDTLPLKV